VTVTPQISLRAPAGRYFQQPLAIFVRSFPQNATLEPFRADHAVAGVVWTPADDTRVTAEVYCKRYRDYPVSSQVGSLSEANIADTFAVRDVLFLLVSAGSGEASGVEVFAERRGGSSERWYGQANVAFSRAWHAGVDGMLRPGAFDSPVVVNALGSLRLAERWRVSTRVSYLSGQPYTPIDAEAATAARRAIYDTRIVNSERAECHEPPQPRRLQLGQTQQPIEDARAARCVSNSRTRVAVLTPAGGRRPSRSAPSHIARANREVLIVQHAWCEVLSCWLSVCPKPL
jgi:hypothetical protein